MKLNDVFTTFNAESVMNLDFLNWFKSIWTSNSRPHVKTVLQKCIDLNLRGHMIHSFLRYIKFDGKYYVKYPNGYKHVVYGYIDGRFDRYWIYNETGGLIKTDNPKPVNEPAVIQAPPVDKKTFFDLVDVSIKDESDKEKPVPDPSVFLDSIRYQLDYQDSYTTILDIDYSKKTFNITFKEYDLTVKNVSFADVTHHIKLNNSIIKALSFARSKINESC